MHSFYDDVSQNPQIVRAMLGVTHGIQKAVSGLARVTEGWKVHQPLWKLDKGTVLDRFKVATLAHCILPAFPQFLGPAYFPVEVCSESEMVSMTVTVCDNKALSNL